MRKEPASPFVVVISEHHGYAGSPVGMLAQSFVDQLKVRDSESVFFLHTKAKYKPGGLKKSRVWNYLKLYVASFFVILFFRIKCFFTGRVLVILPTTNPPLLYLWVTCLAKVFFFKVLIWFQDANIDFLHRKYGNGSTIMYWVSEFLWRLDNRILSLVDGVITLDEGMSSVLKARLSSKMHSQIFVVPPWITYAEPSRVFRVKSKDHFLKDGVKIIYAGNYGRSHDLSDLFSMLDRMFQENSLKLKICLHFIGLSEEARLELQKKLAGKEYLNVRFFPRRESIQALLDLFLEYDFGLVSLSKEYLGISSPSKVFTYLSQGLPIVYCGPIGSMGSDLLAKKWGISLEGLESFLKGDFGFVEDSRMHHGKIFENPKTKSLGDMEYILDTIVGR